MNQLTEVGSLEFAYSILNIELRRATLDIELDALEAKSAAIYAKIQAEAASFSAAKAIVKMAHVKTKELEKKQAEDEICSSTQTQAAAKIKMDEASTTALKAEYIAYLAKIKGEAFIENLNLIRNKKPANTDVAVDIRLLDARVKIKLAKEEDEVNRITESIKAKYSNDYVNKIFCMLMNSNTFTLYATQNNEIVGIFIGQIKYYKGRYGEDNEDSIESYHFKEYIDLYPNNRALDARRDKTKKLLFLKAMRYAQVKKFSFSYDYPLCSLDGFEPAQDRSIPCFPENCFYRSLEGLLSQGRRIFYSDNCKEFKKNDSTYLHRFVDINTSHIDFKKAKSLIQYEVVKSEPNVFPFY